MQSAFENGGSNVLFYCVEVAGYNRYKYVSKGWLIHEIGDFRFDDDLTVYKGI